MILAQFHSQYSIVTPETPRTEGSKTQREQVAVMTAIGPLTNEQLYDGSHDLRVDVFHLNIGIGDCSIHFLVEPKSATRTLACADPHLKQGYIHRAVLIDGGLPGRAQHNGSNLIREFLTGTGAGLYDFDRTQGGRTGGHELRFPAFDSIVITHWDQDHYGGMYLGEFSRRVSIVLSVFCLCMYGG